MSKIFKGGSAALAAVLLAASLLPIGLMGCADTSDSGVTKSSDLGSPTRVATPKVNPAAGAISADQAIALGTHTAGATIYYTTDGKKPTVQNGILYTEPFTLSALPATVKAIAVKDGMTGSAQLSAAYTLAPPPPAPVAASTASPEAGAISTGQAITLATTTAGAAIYYSTDGSEPTAGSTKYTAPFTLSGLPAPAATVKSIAVKDGIASTVVTAVYTLTEEPQVDTPTVNPGTGTITSGQTITLSTATAGAAIYYTTDGSTPTNRSTKYTAPFTLSGLSDAPSTVKAVAVMNGMTASAVSQAAYTLPPRVASPTANPWMGAIGSGQTITLATATAGATIYYTVNGPPPTASTGTEYTGPFTIPGLYNAPTWVKAIAVKDGMTDSAQLTAEYTKGAVPPPAISPGAGAIAAGQNITISTAIAGATIYFTTDGKEPTGSDLYTGPFTLTSFPATVKAIVKDGTTYSAVVSAGYTYTYTPMAQVAAPTLYPGAGAIGSWETIVLNTRTAGATIYYTIDGSTPTSGSEKYTGPFAPPALTYAPTTINAIAVKDGMTDSAVGSAAYTKLEVDIPTADPEQGTLTRGQTITLATATPGATIYYTTDGSKPTRSSEEYTGPFTLPGINTAIPITVKAIAVKGGMIDSEVLTAAYTYKFTTQDAYRDMVNLDEGSIIGSGTEGVFPEARTPQTKTPPSLPRPSHDLIPHLFDPPDLSVKTVTLQPLAIAKYETTWELWQEVYDWAVLNGYTFQHPGAGDGDKYPVADISWHDAIVWCNAYSELCGKTPVYTSSGTVIKDSTNETACDGAELDMTRNGYRLPTEAEWEYAARGGDQKGDPVSWNYTYAGSDVPSDVAWYDTNSGGRTHEVGTKYPTRKGLYDMAGNVLEWCWDWVEDIDASTPVTGPDVGAPVWGHWVPFRSMRGGNWYNSTEYLPSTYRSALPPYHWGKNFGFRVAQSR